MKSIKSNEQISIDRNRAPECTFKDRGTDICMKSHKGSFEVKERAGADVPWKWERRTVGVGDVCPFLGEPIYEDQCPYYDVKYARPIPEFIRN